MKISLGQVLTAAMALIFVSNGFGEERKSTTEWNNLTERQKQERIEKEKRTYQEKQNNTQSEKHGESNLTERQKQERLNKGQGESNLTERQKQERSNKEQSERSGESNLTEGQKRERREKASKEQNNSSESGKKVEGLKIISFSGIDGRVVGKLKSIDSKENLIVITTETQDILQGEVTGKDVTIRVTKEQLEAAKEGDRIKVRIKSDGAYKVSVQ